MQNTKQWECKGGCENWGMFSWVWTLHQYLQIALHNHLSSRGTIWEFPSFQCTLRVLTLLLNNTFKSIPAPVLGIVSSTQPSANWICDQQNTMQWDCKVLGWIIEVWLYQSKHISAEMGFHPPSLENRRITAAKDPTKYGIFNISHGET